jgi:adenine-specific DNA-methyltransferase
LVYSFNKVKEVAGGMMVKKYSNSKELIQQDNSWNAMKQVDFLQNALRNEGHQEEKSAFGQFFTPNAVAELMASMLTCQSPEIRILDPGAGVGSLFTAAVTTFCLKENPPRHILVTAYEIDDKLLPFLESAMSQCKQLCTDHGIEFAGVIKHNDFIESGVALLTEPETLFTLNNEASEQFNCAVLNPPYKKIHSNWLERRLLRKIGVEASNLYVGFLALAMRMLAPAGELIAITPRSFCNGPYFRKFRQDFLHMMALQRIHVFESRTQAFSDEGVLQENIILHATKMQNKPDQVMITTSTGAEDEYFLANSVSYEQVVQKDDSQMFIRIVQNDYDDHVIKRMSALKNSLEDLGISISTGRVVDFRALDFLRMNPEADTVPLFYPVHLQGGSVNWPLPGNKKANAIVDNERTQTLLVPNGYYVLIRRFSSKEEKRRVVATVYKPELFPYPRIGFENHLNYFHQDGQGLNSLLAEGLTAYLNSTLVDFYFRQFNGHTQVNATDLRSIKYPSRVQLEALGGKVRASHALSQDELDALITEELFSMGNDTTDEPDEDHLDHIKRKIDEALRIIRSLGFLRAQQNERSALTLLTLLNLKPDTPWSQAENPLRGITPMMDFFREHYHKDYKPNTRETIRRQTVHQFLEAGLIEANPDQPGRPVNSPKAVYRVERGALELFRTFTTPEWEQNLRTYLASVETLRKRYAKEREMNRIPVTLSSGKLITLSPGGQNILIEKVIQEFAPRFVPGGKVLYIGDADEKFAYFDQAGLEDLGIKIELHGKMPDLILSYERENWLILIEAVTSHGPIDGKRKDELERLFGGTRPGLVFVTTFLTRVAMLQFMKDIAWETEAWIAETPDHLIHFNGQRLLGPYGKR